MTYKSNKFKSITKELIGPNIIFPAVCVLLGADMCGISNTAGKVPIGYFDGSPASTQANGLKDPSRAKSDTLGVMSLLGKGTLLNLGDGYQCGIFVASATKEALIIKLPEGGWMQLIEQPQQGGQGRQTDILPVYYDAAPDPRIIKVDHAVLNLLLQPLGLGQLSDIAQCSIDKEDFWYKIAKDDAWCDIGFFYKKPIGAIPTFTYDGITLSTEFTKKLYQKSSSINSLISSTLSIRGSLPSVPLKGLEKVGFVLVKDKNGLLNLLKTMLESGAEWGTKAAVAETKDYITCPAPLDGDVLQFESSDLDLQPQDDLEDYKSTYCYLKDKDGEYCRLIELENVKSLVEKESAKKQYCWNQVVRVPEQSTAAIPPKESVDKNGSVILESSPSEKEEQTKNLCISTGDTDGTKTDNPNELPLLSDWTLQNAAHKNDGYHNGVNVEQTDSIINSPVGKPTQNGNHKQPVRTAPTQYTGSSGSAPPPPPPPPPPSPLPPLPMLNTNGLAGSAPPPPPPLPPLPTGSVLPSVDTSKQDGSYTAKTDETQKSNGGSMVDELKAKLHKRGQQQIKQPQSINDQIVANKKDPKGNSVAELLRKTVNNQRFAIQPSDDESDDESDWQS